MERGLHMIQFCALLRMTKQKSPRRTSRRRQRVTKGLRAYLACANFEACALAREAAFLWTTPDFVALSIAEL